MQKNNCPHLAMLHRNADLSAGVMVRKDACVIHENFVNGQSQHVNQQVLISTVADTCFRGQTHWSETFWGATYEKKETVSNWKLFLSSLTWRLNKDTVFGNMKTGIKGAYKNSGERWQRQEQDRRGWADVLLPWHSNACACTIGIAGSAVIRYSVNLPQKPQNTLASTKWIA